jgi:hypothetical protein
MLLWPWAVILGVCSTVMSSAVSWSQGGKSVVSYIFVGSEARQAQFP